MLSMSVCVCVCVSLSLSLSPHLPLPAMRPLSFILPQCAHLHLGNPSSQLARSRRLSGGPLASEGEEKKHPWLDKTPHIAFNLHMDHTQKYRLHQLITYSLY